MRLTPAVLMFCLSAVSAQAGNITLNADNQVEYHQKEQKLVASGNAVAAKDDMTIKADKLIGFYTPSAPNKISRIEALKDVVLTTPETQAFGNSLIYSVDTDSAVLKGEPARIKTADADITAKGSITYYQSEQKAVAVDNVTAVDTKGNKVRADLMTAWFTKDADNKLTLDKIDIEKNLKITAQDADITAVKGTYFARTGKIKLFEDVVINQNGNILKGDTAEADLNTGISKILSGAKSSRVSGVFKEKKKKD